MNLDSLREALISFWKILKNGRQIVIEKKIVIELKKEENQSEVEIKIVESFHSEDSSYKNFLDIPIEINGEVLTPEIAKVSAVIDHSGTPIDPSSSIDRWYIDNLEVRAFNGEIGKFKKFKEEKGAGFSMDSGQPFLANERINYVGVSSQGGNAYLQYDGHSGYDFRYSKGTQIIAPADGILYKAFDDRSVNGGIDGNNTAWYKNKFNKDGCTAWEGWHSFYINHLNGFSTWFLHCEKLEDSIEKEILLDYKKSVSVKRGQLIAYIGAYGFNFDNYHLHFEVRDKNGKIVDPYLCNLWRIN